MQKFNVAYLYIIIVCNVCNFVLFLILGKTTLKHRRVKHYGYEFNYTNNNIDKHKPMTEKIPVECNFIFKKLRELGYDNILASSPDQLTVNEYQPGQGQF